MAPGRAVEEVCRTDGGAVGDGLGRTVESHPARVHNLRADPRAHIEFGNEAIVDSLPGVPGGSAYVGTFDREEAVEDESIDFFASGHPLVEGVLAYVEDMEDRRRVSGR